MSNDHDSEQTQGSRRFSAILQDFQDNQALAQVTRAASSATFIDDTTRSANHQSNHSSHLGRWPSVEMTQTRETAISTSDAGTSDDGEKSDRIARGRLPTMSDKHDACNMSNGQENDVAAPKKSVRLRARARNPPPTTGAILDDGIPLAEDTWLDHNAILDEGVTLAEDAWLDHNAILDDGVTLAEDTWLDHNAILDDGVTLAEDAWLDHNAILVEGIPLDEDVSWDEGVRLDHNALSDEGVLLDEDGSLDDDAHLDEDSLSDEGVLLDAEVPLDQDATLDVDVPFDAEVPLDQDATLNADVPFDAEVPLDEDIPLDEYVPLEADVPLDTIAVLDEDVPSDANVPLGTDVPLDQKAILDGDVPLEKRESIVCTRVRSGRQELVARRNISARDVTAVVDKPPFHAKKSVGITPPFSALAKKRKRLTKFEPEVAGRRRSRQHAWLGDIHGALRDFEVLASDVRIRAQVNENLLRRTQQKIRYGKNISSKVLLRKPIAELLAINSDSDVNEDDMQTLFASLNIHSNENPQASHRDNAVARISDRVGFISDHEEDYDSPTMTERDIGGRWSSASASVTSLFRTKQAHFSKQEGKTVTRMGSERTQRRGAAVSIGIASSANESISTTFSSKSPTNRSISKFKSASQKLRATIRLKNVCRAFSKNKEALTSSQQSNESFVAPNFAATSTQTYPKPEDRPLKRLHSPRCHWSPVPRVGGGHRNLPATVDRIRRGELFADHLLHKTAVEAHGGTSPVSSHRGASSSPNSSRRRGGMSPTNSSRRAARTSSGSLRQRGGTSPSNLSRAGGGKSSVNLSRAGGGTSPTNLSRAGGGTSPTNSLRRGGGTFPTNLSRRENELSPEKVAGGANGSGAPAPDAADVFGAAGAGSLGRGRMVLGRCVRDEWEPGWRRLEVSMRSPLRTGKEGILKQLRSAKKLAGFARNNKTETKIEQGHKALATTALSGCNMLATALYNPSATNDAPSERPVASISSSTLCPPAGVGSPSLPSENTVDPTRRSIVSNTPDVLRKTRMATLRRKPSRTVCIPDMAVARTRDLARKEQHEQELTTMNASPRSDTHKKRSVDSRSEAITPSTNAQQQRISTSGKITPPVSDAKQMSDAKLRGPNMGDDDDNKKSFPNMRPSAHVLFSDPTTTTSVSNASRPRRTTGRNTVRDAIHDMSIGAHPTLLEPRVTEN